MGGKSKQLHVNKMGKVDAASEGKNAWDEAVQNLVPLILDLSVIKWRKQKLKFVKKLRATLDNEFNYVEQPLSMLGFKTTITKFLKSERSCLKVRWQKRVTKCPSSVEFEDQWYKLIEHWNTDAQ